MDIDPDPNLRPEQFALMVVMFCVMIFILYSI